MKTAITEGIKISVVSNFKAQLSREDESEYYFDYRITIENINSFPVQLMRRDWFIYDLLKEPRYVSGEGVVGQQPVLESGEVYTYSSGCDLYSEFGYMAGHYTFLNVHSQVEFPVLIPKFELFYPVKMN